MHIQLVFSWDFYKEFKKKFINENEFTQTQAAQQLDLQMTFMKY
jgi:hypothetical protein